MNVDDNRCARYSQLQMSEVRWQSKRSVMIRKLGILTVASRLPTANRDCGQSVGFVLRQFAGLLVNLRMKRLCSRIVSKNAHNAGPDATGPASRRPGTHSRVRGERESHGDYLLRPEPRGRAARSAVSRIPSGFYIDVGACHPVVHSVTKLFYERGWNGINIDRS